MQLRSNIHGLRIGSTPYQLVVACDFLLVSFCVTLGIQSINITDVHMRGTHTAVRNFLGLGHNGINPSHIIGNEFGSTAGMSLNILGEHSSNISIARLDKAADIGVLEVILLHINFHSSFQRTDPAGLCQL